MKVRGWLALVALAIAIVLAGCSRADPSIIAAAPEATSGAGDTNVAGGGPTSLDVAADPTQLKFQQETLNAAEGQTITVNFNNPAAVAHNWVLVQPGQEDAVAQATTASNGDPTGITGVIAGMAPITSSSATVEVPAQQAGTYPYICTVPGHYAAGMKGTLTVGSAAAGDNNQTAGGTEPASGASGVLAVAADQAALKFQQEALTGKAEQPLTVNFENPSALQHNWVLVQPGQEDAVAQATTASNGDPTGITGVIAGNPPIASSSATVEVPAQQAGTYPYICTVPGHYAAGMKGTLTLEP
ncbi:MAG TPA: plastocyanin/azurin family copper-binding protein [Herpetosiphonaceae bacterium]